MQEERVEVCLMCLLHCIPIVFLTRRSRKRLPKNWLHLWGIKVSYRVNLLPRDPPGTWRTTHGNKVVPDCGEPPDKLANFLLTFSTYMILLRFINRFTDSESRSPPLSSGNKITRLRASIDANIPLQCVLIYCSSSLLNGLPLVISTPNQKTVLRVLSWLLHLHQHWVCKDSNYVCNLIQLSHCRVVKLMLS